LTHCACEVLNKHSAAKILCCAPQNFTADIICSELRKKGIDSKKTLRLNDPRRPIYSTKEDVLDFCCIDDAGGTFLVPDELDEYSVIVCTCLSSEYLSPGSRTHVMIDEAGQALLPESLLALQALCYDKDPLNTGWGSILCGDPKQLGPIVRNKLASQCGLQKSLLACAGVSNRYCLFLRRSCPLCDLWQCAFLRQNRAPPRGLLSRQNFCEIHPRAPLQIPPRARRPPSRDAPSQREPRLRRALCNLPSPTWPLPWQLSSARPEAGPCYSR
jgi:hypothetical protein